MGYSMENAVEMAESMYERARTIQDLSGSGVVSNEELKVLSHEFFNDYGCDWTEILDKQKMVDKVKKGQKIYYYRNIWDVVEKGTVEDSTIITDVVGASTDHPTELKLIKNVHWYERVYEDGNSAALLDNIFLTAKEAYEYQNAMLEKHKEELRNEITGLEDLLKFPLNHCLRGERCDNYAREVYEDVCQKILSGEIRLYAESGIGK